jgi:hypothetical protein
MRKWHWITVAVLVGLLTTLVVIGLSRVQPLPFDGAAWRASEQSSPLRYRMSTSLVRDMTSGRWSFERVLGELGPPLDGASTAAVTPESGQPVVRYLLKHPLGLRSRFMLVVFDRHGNVQSASVHSE